MEEERLAVEQQISTAETTERAVMLSPELQSNITRAWTELQGHLTENRAASVVVMHETSPQTKEDELLAREIMMAGLGVRDHQVETFASEKLPGNRGYLERITTNIPGVDIVYADNPDGARAISLAVNHDESGQQRTTPTDIERVLRTMNTHSEWMKSVEQFGAHWNNKKEAVAGAKLLAIDIDDCILPNLQRRPGSVETLQALANELRKVSETSMNVILNTARSAPETQRVLEYFESLGLELKGAITEGGAIKIGKNEKNEWEMQQNPTIAVDQLEAMRVCKEYIDEHYIKTGMGYQEPKISAVTFNLSENSGTTGHQIVSELRTLLVERGMPTDAADKADKSDGGFQLLAACDKAAGMRYIQQELGTTKEQTIAIGDSKGDLPMFSEAGVTAVPLNAAKELRVEADYYSPFDTEYGVLDTAKQISRLRTPEQSDG